MSTVLGLYDGRFQLAAEGPKSTITLSDTFAVTPGADNADVAIDLGAITPTSVDTGSGAITTTGTVSGGTGTFTGTVTAGVSSPTKLVLPSSQLTIASGAVAVTKSRHTIEGEGAAADDLTTATGGAAGQILILSAANAAHDITVKHNTGANQFQLAGGADCVLGITQDQLVLISDGTNWNELCRSINHA